MAEISQAAAKIGTFRWTEGDPISLQWRVNANWSGTYTCQIRKTRKLTGLLIGTMTVVAQWDTVTYPDETLFTFTMSEVNSTLIPVGKYFLDMQVVNGVTRIWGDVVVDPQVTADP